MKKQHKPTKKLKKLPANSPYQKSENWGKRVYEDFPGESRGKKLIYCERCCQWMAPPGIHTCSEPSELPEHWGEMCLVKKNNRSVKPIKHDWLYTWQHWIDEENRLAKSVNRK